MRTARKSYRRRKGNKLFVEELTLRDVRFNRVLNIRDQELARAMNNIRAFINDKVQTDNYFNIEDIKTLRTEIKAPKILEEDKNYYDAEDF